MVPRKRRRKTLKPIPALGRKLLTLIQAVGLNQLELVPEYISPGLVGSVNRIKEVLDEHTMGNGTQLNMLFSCAPWLSLERINDMLTQLEVSLLPIAPGVDFATAVALRRMATLTGATPAYLLAPEVSALLFYMPDLRHHMLFSTFWNTGVRIGESRTLTSESFDLDGLRPFVKVQSEKVRARRGRPPKDEARLIPLTDESYVRQMHRWMVTTRPPPA